jgi:type 1 glutamine amidotransferase
VWSAPAAAQGGSGPLRVLVFSKPYGFAHASIADGVKWLTSLNGQGFEVVNTVNPADLSAANLAGYDVLVWNNSTGNVPLDEDTKREMLDWVRAGHGFLGIHSSGDSNYSWPEFIELSGGLYLAHLYKFGGGGITPDPTPMKVVQEDRTNPLLAGVPEDFLNQDETYRWQLDPRPDVHVLMSMDNTSVYEGATYNYRSPIVWCRPFGAGRTWYTNMGHGTWQYTDPVFTKMLRAALLYTGGRLKANCDPPADPYTGVKAGDRMEAVWADKIDGAQSAVSTYSGGLAVLTKITPGASITWRNVDLGGVKNIDVFAAAQTISEPNNTEGFGLVGSPTQQRILPADGGPVEIHLDTASGPLLGTVSIPQAPSYLDHFAVPEEAALAYDGLRQTSWHKLTPSSFTTKTGIHDLVLTFPGTSLTGSIGSLGWIHLAK